MIDYTNLRDTLASLYLDKESSQRIVTDAKIRPELVKFSDKAIDNWSNIIQEAIKHGLLIHLLEVVLREYPGNAVLKDALSVLKDEVSSDGLYKGGVPKPSSVRSHSSRNKLPPRPGGDLVKQQDAINETLDKIQDKFGYNWMFVLLRRHVDDEGSQQSLSRLDEWLKDIQTLASDIASEHDWQLLCMDKHIELLGIPDMANKLLSAFSEKYSLAEPDTSQFLRFAADHVHERLESISASSGVLTTKHSLTQYADNLTETVAEIEELEQELASIKAMLNIYNCSVNEKNILLPQDKIDTCLNELLLQLKNSTSTADLSGVPVLTRSRIASRLRELNEQKPEYKKWLLETATSIETSRKIVFSPN